MKGKCGSHMLDRWDKKHLQAFLTACLNVQVLAEKIEDYDPQKAGCLIRIGISRSYNCSLESFLSPTVEAFSCAVSSVSRTLERSSS